MVAPVQLGVSERAVPKNAIPSACPLAQMVSRSANLSLGHLSEPAGLVPRLACLRCSVGLGVRCL